MLRLWFLHVGFFLALATPGVASGQSADAPPPPPPSAPQAAPSGFDGLRSLFEPASRQFELGGRVSNTDGDPARFQRYQDFGDGVLLSAVRYAQEQAGGLWAYRVAADNVGWRDQRFAGTYERVGRFTISGVWDQIPQFYSVDTKTPYLTSTSPLVLDDAIRRQIQNGQATLSAYVPVAPQFDLREGRDIGNVKLVATPTPHVDLNAAFTTTKHSGELPWGSSFGFANDVEVPLPYESRTNDVVAGAEWMNSRRMFRVAYNGSWFDNLEDTLIWDNPLRATDSTAGPGRGRTALWPSNSAQTFSAAGYTKFARRTQVTGSVSYGLWNNDEPLLPFTINSALPPLTTPRANTEGEAHVVSANVSLVSRPLTDWRFSARARTYDYNNETTPFRITQYVSYDTTVNRANTGGPELYAHSKTTLDADAIWTALQPVAVTIGYTRNHGGYDSRIFESTAENVFRVMADAIGAQWVTFRANYEYGDRSGSGLDESLLTEIGEQPAMRHYDVANRRRNRFTGQVDVTPNEVWVFSTSAGLGKDDYPDSHFGLHDSTFRTFSVSADFHQPNGFGGGGSYNYERYAGLQQSRSANPGQEGDPLRDWTADSKEHVNYFSIYVSPPRLGRNTEARVSYDYSYAKGDYLYTVVPGGPLPSPSQLPRVYNKLQQLHADIRHRLTSRLAATLSYLYEPFRVYDFAFDSTTVDGIVQPSALVLGYVYRPYTVHSAIVGLKYLF